MFTHKYRYIFALLLSVYTYLNTEFCNVYDYFNIRIEWFYAFATIALISFMIMETNRLIEPYIRRIAPPERFKKRFPAVFFIAGSLIATVITSSIVLLMGMVVHPYSFAENIIP